jgi:ribonuclease HIII
MDITRAVDIYNQICRDADPAIYRISEYRQIDYGIQFTISTTMTSGLLRVYQNKKGILKLDTSQLKSNQILGLISALLPDLINPSDQRQEQANSSLEGIDKLVYPMIGTDESGKGDYFGPLVIASALVDADSEKKLAAIGVRDSKKISDSSIREIAKGIKSLLSNQHFSVVPIGPEKYNELYAKIGNLNKLLAWGHARAIENILSRTECQNAIADQFGDESFIRKALMDHGKKIRLVQTPKAERYTAVAAASVLAREGFLVRLAELGHEAGFSLPKGASIEVENVAKRIIGKYGKPSIAKYVKLHFKTTEKL